MLMEAPEVGTNLVEKKPKPGTTEKEVSAQPAIWLLSCDACEVKNLRDALVDLTQDVRVYASGDAMLNDLKVAVLAVSQSANANTERQRLPVLVLAGNLPGWVLKHLYEKVNQTVFEIAGNAEAPPPIMFLPGEGQLADLMNEGFAGHEWIDFLGKPVSHEEFVVRVRKLTKIDAQRAELPSAALAYREGLSHGPRKAGKSMQRFGPYTFFPNDKTVAVGDAAPIKLSTTEFELAWRLFIAPDVVVSREDLLVAAQSNGFLRSESAHRELDAYVSRLRRKLALRSENGFILRSIYGVGYMLATG